jgi:enediyne biosynthesis protein E4
MIHYRREIFGYLFTLFMPLLFLSCNEQKAVKPLFELLEENRTGLHFNNHLSSTQQFNLFNYMYFYNGGGIGAGDFNNDGKIDVFFAGNQVENKLYINKGSLRFEDVSAVAGIKYDSAWSTGVSIVDINNDGMLDIYVCRVGKLNGLPTSNNLLLVCENIDKNGTPHYKEKAHEYGLDFSGFSTQAVFFDYDIDGDLDMYLLNHTIHDNGTFGPRPIMLNTFNALSGDRLYRNDNNKFTDVTAKSGINSSVIGYGLGVAVADINLDGYPDIYIGNDFHENDYMYINQGNGSFKEELSKHLMHSSQFSMGVDIADINNDGAPEIISMDMLPSDPYILKRSLGEDENDIFYEKIKNGYAYQYTRNNLQYNRKNGMFSETGLYSGVAATDWSWAPLWVDFDNDGWKDLFISNGIPKRMNDIDYINFVSNGEIQQKIRDKKIGEKDMGLIEKFPQIKIKNKFYRNAGQLRFNDAEAEIANDKPTYSNGSVYADFDNDGDMDVLVNNIDQAAILYENKFNNKASKNWMDISLMGSKKNTRAIGAKFVIFKNGAISTYDKFPVHGFLSSMEIPLHIGLDSAKIDSMFLIWPDNTYEKINPIKKSGTVSFVYKEGLPKFDFKVITSHWENNTLPMKDITNEVGINFLHKENAFHEFDREPLIPRMVSTEGPAMAVGDMNKDGLEDVFIGGSKWEKKGLFLQQTSGKFIRSIQPALEKDSTYEDIGACWTDVNNDGTNDLVIASGGNEYFGNDQYLLPRVYLNNGKEGLDKLNNAFDSIYVNASSVVPYDFSGDGYVDLFISGRSIPYAYGIPPRSFLLQNDGKGKFKDVTNQYSEELASPGFVTYALWIDINKDERKDLVVCLEWGGIVAYINEQKSFTRKILCNKKGWWNFVLPVDLNNDGNIDFVAGNLGWNSRLNASEKEPVSMYYSDFDGNSKKEQVLTYYMKGKEIPFANKAELEKQLPGMKKKFLYAEDFAKATLQDLFSKDKLSGATLTTANYFSNATLINKGNMEFDVDALPWEAQLSPYRDAVVINANEDNFPDILLTGNYYENNIEMGRYDSDFCTLLINKGNGTFLPTPVNGIQQKGQIRHIQKIRIGGKEAFILAKNNDSTAVITFGTRIK